MAIQINEKKQNRQLVALNRWRCAKDLGLSHSNGWGVFWWETGVGKTYAALLLVSKMLERNPSTTIVILIPGENLEKQWKAEVKANIKPEFQDNFRFYTASKMLNLINEGFIIECSLLIADELHEYYTEERLKFFNGNTIVTKYCLGLTADYEDIKNRHYSIQHILPVVDRIDPEEAEKEGFISEFIEYNLAVQLSESEKANYESLTNIITKNLSKFGKGGLDLASKILSGNKKTGKKGMDIAYAYATHHGWRKDLDLSNPTHSDINALWHPIKVLGYAKAAMDSIRARKDLIYCARNKIIVARDLAIKFDDVKTIFFSQSTAFADVLARTINNHYINEPLDYIPCVVYHSKLETIITTDPVTGKQKKKGRTVLKKEAIEAIVSGKAMRISTASSLDRGTDVKGIRMAVTTSGTQNPTQHRQRGGRAKRVKSYEEKVISLVVNLYIKDTIDERWLRNRQSKSSNTVYWVDSIDDINYTPKANDVFNFKEL